jgi:hypothetical protein
MVAFHVWLENVLFSCRVGEASLTLPSCIEQGFPHSRHRKEQNHE